MLGLDYLALVKYRGTFPAFIFAMLAFGMSFMTLTAAALSNPMQYPAITISNSTSNTIISSYNVTSQLAPTTLGFILPVLQLVILVQFVLAFLSIGGWFLYRRKKRYGVS